MRQTCVQCNIYSIQVRPLWRLIGSKWNKRTKWLEAYPLPYRYIWKYFWIYTNLNKITTGFEKSEKDDGICTHDVLYHRISASTLNHEVVQESKFCCWCYCSTYKYNVNCWIFILKCVIISTLKIGYSE